MTNRDRKTEGEEVSTCGKAKEVSNDINSENIF